MVQIFPVLASFSLLLYLAAVVLGLGIGDLYADPLSEETWLWRRIHMLTGTATALVVVLVHSILVTYFIGTSRWCKEVTETYLLDSVHAARSTELKRKTFPWCLLGMLTVIVVGALGAAADPGNGRPNTASQAIVHQYAAFVGLALVAWTYYRSLLNIVDNQEVIQKIVAAVDGIRRERGLPTTNADAEERPTVAP